ncbi:ISBma1, transposase [Burkholderia pseudomallei]|nr:ISBma1, transposase [Burkholderia pseudomallei]
MTRPERIDPATSIARHSRVYSSITVRHFNCWPLAHASNTKSYAQTCRAAVAGCGRKVLKSSRWLLLRNRHNLKPEQAVHLKELLAANQSLLCVYVLRDELKRLWFYRKPAWAEKAWGQWFEQAQQSGIAALQKFAQRLQGYWHGIVARCRHPLNTSVVEGINNTIKVIKRRAYGYRDEQYFFLKIRAAFPGIQR